MAVSQTIAYRVGAGDQEVRLAVTVGEAQKGATTVYLGGDQVDQRTDGAFSLRLGSRDDVVGKKCICTTVVADVNPQTNRTSVTWALTGGPDDFSKTGTETIDQDGDIVLYSAVIFFI